MGKYGDLRIQRWVNHTNELKEQVQNEEVRKTVERSHERELDRMRAECQEIERNQHNIVQSQRQEVMKNIVRDAYKAATFEKKEKVAGEMHEKTVEMSERKESEVRYKQYMDSYLNERNMLRAQLAAQLQDQIKEKLVEKRGGGQTYRGGIQARETIDQVQTARNEHSRYGSEHPLTSRGTPSIH